MRRRDFFKAGAAVAGTAAAGGGCAAIAERGIDGPADRTAPHAGPANLTIREYLSREAGRIADRALSDASPAADRRRRFMEMMGLQDFPWAAHREPPPVHPAGVVQRPAYRIEKLSYESLPKLRVTANLYIPNNLKGRAPAVLYVCGHADRQKVHYQGHARRFAELGFVCLLVETVQLGEAAGFHHGCYREGWWQWYSRGYTPAGIELLNGMRGLDLLCARPDVDPARLGVTGTSGGGASTWWIAAGDERIRCAATSCGTSNLASYIGDRTIDGHCDCMWFVNTYRWDLADVGALIAPRAFMISSADRDAIFPLAPIRETHRRLESLYRRLGAADRLSLFTYPGPHAYTEAARTRIFAWFLRHLADRQVAPDQVGDLETDPARLESADTLRVFADGSPADNRAVTVHDDFVPPPKPPEIANAAALPAARAGIVAALRERTFGAFPARPPGLDVRVEFELNTGHATGHRFAFTSEDGWRLHGGLTLAHGLQAPAPAVVALRSPGDAWNTAEGFAGGVQAPWARVVVEPRGTGDTAWGEELNWHLRRAAAWTGRTLASMRVWDTLRALQAVRALPQVDAAQVSLAARGEMCAVALYAALLDGNVRTLFLDSPPATQNAPSERNGRGPAIEMLNCLRIADLPHVAGLLFPAAVVVAGTCPPSYAWAQELYRRLGAPKGFQTVPSLSQWRV